MNKNKPFEFITHFNSASNEGSTRQQEDSPKVTEPLDSLKSSSEQSSSRCSDSHATLQMAKTKDESSQGLESSDQDLLLAFKNYSAQERSYHLHIISLLREIERRNLHLKKGFSSLFDFLVRGFGYSETGAFRRIQSLRLLKKAPELQEKLRGGALNLSTMSALHLHLKKIQLLKKGLVEGEAGSQLITDLADRIQNKSSRQANLILEDHFIELKRGLGIPDDPDDEKIQLNLKISKETLLNLDKLRALFSHIKPNMTYEELIDELCRRHLKKMDPSLKSERNSNGERVAPPTSDVDARGSMTKDGKLTPDSVSNQQAESSVILPSKSSNLKHWKKRRRPISAEVKSKIWRRDEGCCAFVDPISGRRCASKFQVQIDHIQPLALGGANDESNLRLLCSAHNQWRASVTFGSRFLS